MGRVVIWLDFETRSECDLPARGAYNYARDPSTKVLCMALALDDGEVEICAQGQKFPKAVADAVANGDTIMAHNAAFERLIWAYVLGPDHGVPVPRLEQFYCTAAQARANCAPGSLEDVGRFAGADMRKDHYQHKSYGRVYTPVFDVQKWIGMDGDAPAQAEADAPAEEPRRRRRAA